MGMQTTTHYYSHDTLPLIGHLAVPDTTTQRPAILVAHDWSGRNAFACEQADALAQLGYVGFALDMYGHAALGGDTSEKMALMQPLMNDRMRLQARLMAAFETVRALPQVDPNRIGIIGFCFGGLCALDLARSGVQLRCAVSFHGLLTPPAHAMPAPIQANILVLHGYDDPMVTPADVLAFSAEMTQKNVDWQLHVYSQTQHAFMVPSANDKNLGTLYQPRSAQRAQRLMVDFLQEQL
jgi:dienelactone hydrolase